MKGRILVVEDNQQNMYLTRFLLEKSGYEVVEAWDGPQGIDLADRVRPGLIIVDIQLPEMDGHQVTRVLRSRPALRGVPIIAVTSYAMPGDREKCLASGCTGYIEKPINPATFVREIESYLAPAPAGKESEDEPHPGS